MAALDRLITAAGMALAAGAAFLSGYALGFYKAEAAMAEEVAEREVRDREDQRLEGGKAGTGVGRVALGLPPPTPPAVPRPANGRMRAASPAPSSDADSDFGDGRPPALGTHRLVLVVRVDLKLTKGKVGSQLCHAALGQFKKMHRAKNPNLWDWEHDGRSTVVLRVSDAAGLAALKASAKAAGIPTHTVIDRSSEHSGPVKTVMAIGPFATDAIGEITGHLSLY